MAHSGIHFYEDHRLLSFPVYKFIQRAFHVSTNFWKDNEVYHGCGDELPMMFLSNVQELSDPPNSWCYVSDIEFSGKVASFFMFEVYYKLLP